MKNIADDMTFEVMDDDFGADEKIAEPTTLKLSAFCVGTGIDNWFDVQWEGKVVGQIHLKSVW